MLHLIEEPFRYDHDYDHADHNIGQLHRHVAAALHAVRAYADIGQKQGRQRQGLRIIGRHDADHNAVKAMVGQRLVLKALVHTEHLDRPAHPGEEAADQLRLRDDLVYLDARIAGKIHVASHGADFVTGLAFIQIEIAHDQYHDPDQDPVMDSRSRDHLSQPRGLGKAPGSQKAGARVADQVVDDKQAHVQAHIVDHDRAYHRLRLITDKEESRDRAGRGARQAARKQAQGHVDAGRQRDTGRDDACKHRADEEAALDRHVGLVRREDQAHARSHKQHRRQVGDDIADLAL